MRGPQQLTGALWAERHCTHLRAHQSPAPRGTDQHRLAHPEGQPGRPAPRGQWEQSPPGPAVTAQACPCPAPAASSGGVHREQQARPQASAGRRLNDSLTRVAQCTAEKVPILAITLGAKKATWKGTLRTANQVWAPGQRRQQVSGWSQTLPDTQPTHRLKWLARSPVSPRRIPTMAGRPLRVDGSFPPFLAFQALVGV